MELNNEQGTRNRERALHAHVHAKGFSLLTPHSLNRGSSLIDVLVGVAILGIVFWGLFGVFRLALIVITTNKAQVGAIALAGDGIEYVRSLPYDSIGNVDGVPSGPVPQTEIINLNDIEYTRRTLIAYADAPEDGLGDDDTNGLLNDYKFVKVTVSWDIKGQEREINTVSYFAPPGIETSAGGGTLSINVLDAYGVPVSGAEIRIINNDLSDPIDLDRFSNVDGRANLIAAPAGGGYEIIVSKEGYSTAETYQADATNVNPTPQELSVAEGALTTGTFQIDKLTNVAVHTHKTNESREWRDDFADTSSLDSSSNTTVSSGTLKLFRSGSAYGPTGFASSVEVSDSELGAWQSAWWDDSLSAGTSALYHVYYLVGTSTKALIPNTDLPGNSSGFTTSPVDLSTLDPTTYSQLGLTVDLATTDASSTPIIDDWGISYQTTIIPAPNIAFSMVGNKTIGETSEGQLIHKYDEDLSTDASGDLDLTLEWDNYNITITDPDYDLVRACPLPPLDVVPDTSTSIDFYLGPATANSLRVNVVDSTGATVDGATVHISRLVYDKTVTTDICGQAYFGGVSAAGDYNLVVSAPGFVNQTINNVSVSEDAVVTVVLATE
jgi:hypothetical protein